MKPFLIVAADLVRTGGMDMANLGLATYLADTGRELHIVAHRVDPELSARPNVTVHRVIRPLRSDLLGSVPLHRAGLRWARKITARGGRVVVNGGNCRWADINWVHYVHAAYRPVVCGNPLKVLKWRAAHRLFVQQERASLHKARVVLANSERTRSQLIELLGLPPSRITTVYLGIDAARFPLPAERDRRQARELLHWPPDKVAVAFIGGLGDRRKGFDTLFAAWKILCATAGWDADLAVIGAGADLPAWKKRAAEAGLGARICFLGFRNDVPEVLPGFDLLVAPTRYEPYGMGAQEAICRGVPVLISAAAGIAERYTPELAEMLLPNPGDDRNLADRLLAWRGQLQLWKERFRPLGDLLRGYSWSDMAARMLAVAEAEAA